MQSSYITESNRAPIEGAILDDMEVIHVSHEFPEDGFSYDDMRVGKCREFVRVTLQSIKG